MRTAEMTSSIRYLAGLVLIVTTAASAWAAGAFAAPGMLDTSFGIGGRVSVPPQSFIRDYALQADGKIVLTSERTYSDTCCNSFDVWRFSRDGVLDASFGDSGRVTTVLEAPRVGVGQVAVQSDGRIVVLAYTITKVTNPFTNDPNALPYYRWDPTTIVRYETDGRLDSTFGNAGRVSLPSDSLAVQLVTQSSGSLIVAGWTPRDSSSPKTMLLRYTSDGVLDASFGQDGMLAIDVVMDNLATQSTGKMILTGMFADSAGAVRLQPEGTLDPTFGVNGRADVRIPDFHCRNLIVQSDDSIVIAGAFSSSGRGGLVRFTAGGQLDTTFGDSGIVKLDFLPYSDSDFVFFNGLASQLDGKLIVSGEYGDLETYQVRWIARFDRGGRLDASFRQGQILYDSSNGAAILGPKLQNDGKILALDYPGKLSRYRGDEVYEFYNTNLGHYFITSNASEQASIVAGGSGPGWAATGEGFKSNGTAQACRFSGTPGIGPNSHFFTTDTAECEAVKRDPGWNFEGYDFSANPLNAGGSCEAGLIPVYRAYNNRFAQNDSNHRYTTDNGIYERMKAAGWIGEGIVFCVPQ